MKKYILNIITVLGALLFSNIINAQNSPVELKYLGTAGWEIKDGNITVLVDPYISRVKLGTGPSISPLDKRETVLRSDYFVSDKELIDSLINKVDFILVHHSHFDHLSDVPYIAKKTGAKVIGTETTINILRGYGINNDQLYPVRGGEDYQFEEFSVRVIPTIHSALNNKHYLDSREYTKPPKTPLKVSDFIEGRSLMFLARFNSHEILTMGSMNFVERELIGVHPDILLAGVNQSQLGLYNYNERLIKVTGYPKTIIPTHWDNFRLPYGLSQESSITLKLLPFKKDVEKLSTKSSVKIVRHLETIKIN
ncbi:MAG: MBL fold metallo-hydrolase [Candidatus Marisimplicoccus sp.]